MASEYQPPSWAGNPKPGLHLDVVKNDSVLQKLLIDEKDYYLFGRNRDVCDFPLQHQSCSRVHAALVHHKNLNRPFLIDLGAETPPNIWGVLIVEYYKNVLIAELQCSQQNEEGSQSISQPLIDTFIYPSSLFSHFVQETN